jgi:hypothetical protein
VVVQEPRVHAHKLLAIKLSRQVPQATLVHSLRRDDSTASRRHQNRF